MVWCHICKRNFSIKTMGTMEILRHHHRSAKHLRRDQRWRYEHLESTYPITGKVQHRVRGRDGKILSKIQLAAELPKFIHMELVDVRERLPFYEDFTRGHTSAIVTPESRAKTQLSKIGHFIKTQGDLTVLRNLWSRLGSFTKFQAPLCDFDWGEERLSVNIIHMRVQSNYFLRFFRYLFLFRHFSNISRPEPWKMSLSRSRLRMLRRGVRECEGFHVHVRQFLERQGGMPKLRLPEWVANHRLNGRTGLSG